MIPWFKKKRIHYVIYFTYVKDEGWGHGIASVDTVLPLSYKDLSNIGKDLSKNPNTPNVTITGFQRVRKSEVEP